MPMPVVDNDKKIIKNGDLTVEVDSLQIGMSRITALATQHGGYIIETKASESRTEKPVATIGIAVPVDQFEATMQAIREAGKRVISEQASGRDVSQEYVDLKSQLDNLEATERRVRQFLEQAKTVDEALRVNTQLSELEGRISQLKGRAQFLNQRAAFSTITVQLRQIGPLPETGPSAPWKLQTVIASSTAALRSVLRLLVTAAIWFVIVVLPLAIPLVALVAGLRLWWQKRRTSASIVQGPAQP
ncbi:MAG: hypothetical protein NVSMB42_20590 [Herpetosiphon sp.]